MDANTRASLDQMECAGYLPALRNIIRSTCVPFWWHGIDAEGKYRIHRNGTVCFLQTGKRLVGVTARHVFNGYLIAKAAQPDIRCQFGGVLINPETRLIAENTVLDLATFDVSEVIVAAAGAAPYTSVTWPSREASASDVVLYGGYPGALRVEHETTADIPFQWFAGTPISVTSENLKLRIDWENFHQVFEGQSIGNADMGGFSGGPVFRLVPAPPVERLELVAFIYEWEPSLSLLFARPAHYIAMDGQLVE
ncbi:MAG: hypothetical protein E8D48_13280 [Nitrospira sp.]|nr:MAG: hypothetical protein E8D48_13280 [Nitrospira sp.]